MHHLIIVNLITIICSALLIAITKKQYIVNMFNITSSLLLTILNIVLITKNGFVFTSASYQIFNYHLAFDINFTSIAFNLMVLTLWSIINIYSISYVKLNNYYNTPQLHCFINLSVAAALFTNFANNRINIFIGYEILTFCTFPLLNLKNDNEGHNASIKYLYNMLISALFLAIGMMLADNNDYNIKAISLLLIIIGTSKVAIIPFNSWLPAAMVAPTPVSALLHAVAVVKTGVIVIIKMVEDYFPSSILENIIINNYFVYNLIMIVISLNIIIANIKAVNLTSIKGILAQSTIINLSYIVFIIISPISDNILYGLTVLLIHAVVKICLFMLTGYLSTNYKIKEVTDLNNVAESVPWVAYGFIICILSMMGTAPVMGFISKKMLIKTINVYNIYTMLVFIFSSICAVYYYGKIIFSLYNYNEYKELSLTSKGKWMQFAITLVLLIIISSSILATYLYFKF